MRLPGPSCQTGVQQDEEIQFEDQPPFLLACARFMPVEKAPQVPLFLGILDFMPVGRANLRYSIFLGRHRLDPR